MKAIFAPCALALLLGFPAEALNARAVARRSPVHGREASSAAAYIDDAPPATPAHARRDGLRHRPGAEQIA